MSDDQNEALQEGWRERELDKLYDALRTIHAFMHEKRISGAASLHDLVEADKAFNDIVIRQGGGLETEAGSPAEIALVRHGLHAMRVYLKTLFPEESDQISRLGTDSEPRR